MINNSTKFANMNLYLRILPNIDVDKINKDDIVLS